MKTVVFLVIAVAALGAAGVTTAIMISPVPVHAAGECHSNQGSSGCTGSFPGSICNNGGCHGTGRGTSR